MDVVVNGIMKSTVIFMAVCLSLSSFAAEQKPAPYAVEVKVLAKPFPPEENMRDKFLWDSFANKPAEEQFGAYGADHWKDNFKIFAGTLVNKAAGLKLDSTSLRKVLDLVLNDSNDKIAYLPVGAYQTAMDGELIWIITVKWEYPSMAKDSGLGHIRIFAFNQKSFEKVGFVTCG